MLIDEPTRFYEKTLRECIQTKKICNRHGNELQLPPPDPKPLNTKLILVHPCQSRPLKDYNGLHDCSLNLCF